MANLIYKIVARQLWLQAEPKGVFDGAPVDHADGYIHFSTEAQVRETAAKHFAGVDGLLLVAIDANALGDKLIYEPSRGGALFPHLYEPLPLSAVVWVQELPLAEDSSHIFPELHA